MEVLKSKYQQPTLVLKKLWGKSKSYGMCTTISENQVEDVGLGQRLGQNMKDFMEIGFQSECRVNIEVILGMRMGYDPVYYFFMFIF